MRLQLMRPDAWRRGALAITCVLGVLGVLGAAAPARGDGALTMRGVYYKERATRVMQPMLDGMFDAGTHGIITSHFLVDAITSASASSGAADAAAFTENRYEGGLGYAHELGGITLAANAKISTESDYRSRYAGARAQAELGQKNTVLGLGGGISLDTINAAAAQGPSMPTLRCDAAHPAETSCSLGVYSMYASASQIVSRNAVIGVSLDVSALRGFQSNPYRQAIVGETLISERHPTERTREAFAASARYYIAPTGTTVIGAYRYYRDSWKVHAHTPELRIVQEAGYSADASVRYRYYTQDSAYFFHERYPPDDEEMTQYVSDDVKLSDFNGHTLEAKLGVLGEAFELGGRWASARFEGILEYVIQHNRFGNAVVAHVALTLPFDY
jgi:hypothetical protein